MPKIKFVEVWRGWEPGQEYDCESWFAEARIADGTAVLVGSVKPPVAEPTVEDDEAPKRKRK